MAVSLTYNTDCLDFMKEYPDGFFDLACVDPPYGLPKDSSNGRGKLSKRVFNMGHISDWDKAPGKEYWDELFRVSKNQIVWGGNYFPLPPTRGIIVWDKVQPWENFSQVELAWTSYERPASLFRFDNRIIGKIHPTQKPIALYKWLFERYSKQGDKILDTHLGSGSSRIAAYDLGIDFYGCEINPDYFKSQEERFEKWSNGGYSQANDLEQPSLFD